MYKRQTNVCADHWLKLARLIESKYEFYDGFVLCHGTDTMAYTAAALSYLIQNNRRPIVITGAQKPCLLYTSYIMKEKAADYGVEVTSDDETAIADAAAQFMQDNDEDTLKELAVSEDQVKTLLELETYRQRIYDPIRNEAEVNITDEEAQQSSFSYVSISISGDDLTDDDIATRKEQAQEILDKMKEDPTADMGETAKAVDDTYSGLTGTIFTNDSDDEDISNSYDDAVVEALRTLKDGEVYDELVETDSSVYVLRMDKVKDEDATASKKESLENTKRSEYYSETTQKWLDDADITVNDKVLSTLTITDEHSFTIKETTADTSEDAAADTTDATEDTTSEDAEAADEDEDADTAETDAAKSDSAEEADTTDSADSTDAVSYTHLDVYKRQALELLWRTFVVE